MTDVDQNQDDARAGSAAGAESGSESGASSDAGSASRAGVRDSVRTDVQVESPDLEQVAAAAASATSGTLVDFAPAMALANLLISSTQSLSMTMLDMPSRAQSESIVRLATTARAARQALEGCRDTDPERGPGVGAGQGGSGCGCQQDS